VWNEKEQHGIDAATKMNTHQLKRNMALQLAVFWILPEVFCR
jgi:hypothetical protein